MFQEGKKAKEQCLLACKSEKIPVLKIKTVKTKMSA